MRVYVAGRFARYERCRALIDAVAAAGHEITNDWTRGEWFDADGHPLGSDADLPVGAQADLAADAIRGCESADLVVVVADEPLCGACIELGVALANGVPVWVIAPWRWAIFWARPLMTVIPDEAEARRRLGCTSVAA
jgi:hypothetical protein